jgi:DNA-binding response OmpR family regulator
LKRLKSNKRHNSIPFIFITASAEKKEVEEGLRMGAAGYLIKPYEADDLFSLIRNHIEN